MGAVPGRVLSAVARHVLDQLGLDGPAIVRQVLQELRTMESGGADQAGTGARLRQALRRQLDRKDRALEAYLDGALSRAELNRLTARWEEEQIKLTARLEQLEECPDRSAQNQALLAQVLEDEALLLDEIIQQITVGTDSFLIQPAELPLQFEVRARGTGRNYRTQVLSCDIRPLPPPL